MSNLGYSRKLQRALCDFGMEQSFAKAKDSIREHYGFDLAENAVARITKKHAKLIRDSNETKHVGALPHEGSECIVAEADGSFIRIVETSVKKGDRRKNRVINYQEARLCAATSQGSKDIHYEATLNDVTEVGLLWAKSAKNAGMGLNSKVHAIGDGAKWIESQAIHAFGAQGSYLIDFFHLCEYLAQAAPSCTIKVKRWMNTQKKRLKTGHYLRVLTELEKELEPSHIPDENAPVRRAYRYMINRTNCFDYETALKENLPIGSGLIESGHKHVIQARMKIPGASWNLNTAENMLGARTCRANGLWNDYWTKSAA